MVSTQTGGLPLTADVAKAAAPLTVTGIGGNWWDGSIVSGLFLLHLHPFTRHTPGVGDLRRGHVLGDLVSVFDHVVVALCDGKI